MGPSTLEWPLNGIIATEQYQNQCLLGTHINKTNIYSGWLRRPAIWVQSAANGSCRRIRSSNPRTKENNSRNYRRILIQCLRKSTSSVPCKLPTAMENVAIKVDAFLQYAATYPVTKVAYHASDMTLHTHSDASYLGESKSRSHFAGFHFLGQQHWLGTIPTTPTNGGLLIRSSILDDVVVFSAELGGLFENMRDAIKLRNILADVGGYPQSASPIQTDNNCAEGIAHGTVKSIWYALPLGTRPGAPRAIRRLLAWRWS